MIQILDTFFKQFVIEFETLVLRFEDVIRFTGEQRKLFVEIGIYFSNAGTEQSAFKAAKFDPFQFCKFNNRVEKPLKTNGYVNANVRGWQ